MREGTRRSLEDDDAEFDDEGGEEEGGEEEVGSRTGLTGRAITNANCTAFHSFAARGPRPRSSPTTLKAASQRSTNMEMAQLMTSATGSKASGASAKKASRGRVEATAAATRRRG